MTQELDHKKVVVALEGLVADLEKNLSSAIEYGATDFASRISMESTKYELDTFRQRLESARVAAKVAELDDEMHVFIRPEQDPHGPVPMASLGKFMYALQSFANAIGQFGVDDITRRGRVQKQVLIDSSLYAVGGISGSFGVRIQGASKKEDQQNFLGDDRFEIPDLIMEFFDSEKFDRDSVMTMCSVSPRLFTTYKEMLSIMSKQRIDIVVASRYQPFSVGLTSKGASERELELLSLEVDEQQLVLSGKLVGASLIKDRFEFESGDNIIKGSATHFVSEKIASLGLFGRRVRATIIETVEKQSEGLTDPVSRYEMIDIESGDFEGDGLFAILPTNTP